MIIVAKQQATIDDLRSQIYGAAAFRREASLESQAQCARQAKIRFDAEEFKATDMASYRNHLSARLNKCIVLIESRTLSSQGISDSRDLVDAYENKVFGRYLWSSDGKGKASDMPPRLCEVMALTSDRLTCTSQREFEQLIRQYMEG
jgi:hypothetical protein